MIKKLSKEEKIVFKHLNCNESINNLCEKVSVKLFTNEKVYWSIDNLKNLPKQNGIYVLCDKDGIVLYIGETKNIYDRVYNHHRTGKASALTDKIKDFFSFQTDDQLSDYLSECYLQYGVFLFGRREVEEYLIKQCKPRFNNYKIQLRKGQITKNSGIIP